MGRYSLTALLWAIPALVDGQVRIHVKVPFLFTLIAARLAQDRDPLYDTPVKTCLFATRFCGVSPCTQEADGYCKVDNSVDEVPTPPNSTTECGEHPISNALNC